MKRGFPAREIDDHELVVVQKLKQAPALVQRKVGGIQSMHVTHHALTVASAGDSEDGGPLVPSKIMADPGERQQRQRDFTDVRAIPASKPLQSRVAGGRRSAVVIRIFQATAETFRHDRESARRGSLGLGVLVRSTLSASRSG